MSEYEKIRMSVSHGPDLHFQGRIVHEYSTQRKDGGKDRWTELRLWETPAGNWIAESVGISRRHGEGEIREARVVDAPRDKSVTEANRTVEEVMDHFQWTSAAKAFAREMNWDVIRRVE